MTLQDVADHLGVGWDLVKSIFQYHLCRKLKKRRLSSVRYIAVDEFAIRKGHQYMTVVMDLESGAILSAEPGKDAQALIPFLRRLKRSRARIRAVAIDMSQAYINAVQATEIWNFSNSDSISYMRQRTLYRQLPDEPIFFYGHAEANHCEHDQYHEWIQFMGRTGGRATAATALGLA
jgi:hypothetical protein